MRRCRFILPCGWAFLLAGVLGCGSDPSGKTTMDSFGEVESDAPPGDAPAEAETGAEPDGRERGDAEEPIPDYIPQSLTEEWRNLSDMDMVTVRKKIIFEFQQGTPMPKNKKEEAWYNKRFAATLVEWDMDFEVPVSEVKLAPVWLPERPGLNKRPKLILAPVRCNIGAGECAPAALDGILVATKIYRVTVNLGQEEPVAIVFHTIPAWSAGYKIVDFIVEPDKCERCFPYPVHVNVFVPPEYNSPDPWLNNTSTPWGNTNQRYSAVVGLHTYNAQGLTLAETFGWSTLPRFTSQGVLEPILLVLPDATVPEPYCQGGWQWPVTSGKTCYTQFMGIPNPEQIPNFNAYTNYAYFMTHTMRREIAKRFRIRHMDDEGNKLDNQGNIIDEEHPDDNAGRDYYRRAWGVTGCSGGGFGTPINAFLFAEDWGSMFALIGASPSMFNPYIYWNQGGITYEQICNTSGNASYPYEPVGDGYRDLAMMDPTTVTTCPEGMVCARPHGYCVPADQCPGTCDSSPCWSTGQLRDVTIEQRHVPAGGKSCFWFSPPGISNAIVLSVLCGLDTTCRADPGAPDIWRTDFDKYSFEGNIMFTTGTLDFEGPAAAFIDLDLQLDKRGVAHSFRYEDRGAIYHDWNAVHDYVEGHPTITRSDGEVVPGNFPNTGLLYPWFNAAFEGIGNRPFNDPSSSEYTTGAMDPDRDYVIDLDYKGITPYSFIEDNCPGVYNPGQEDSDGDGLGNACDEDSE